MASSTTSRQPPATSGDESQNRTADPSGAEGRFRSSVAAGGPTLDSRHSADSLVRTKTKHQSIPTVGPGYLIAELNPDCSPTAHGTSHVAEDQHTSSLATVQQSTGEYSPNNGGVLYASRPSSGGGGVRGPLQTITYRRASILTDDVMPCHGNSVFDHTAGGKCHRRAIL